VESDAGVAKGVAALYVATVTTLGLNTLFLILLTNYVQVAEVGLVSLLNVLVVSCATISVLALPLGGAGAVATPPAVTRFLSQYLGAKDGSARKVYLVSLLVCLVVSLSLAAIVSSPQVASLIAGPLEKGPVTFAALDAIVYSFGQLGAYAMLGAGRTVGAGKLIVLSSVLRYVFAAAFLLTGHGPSGVFIGFALGDAVLAVAANVTSFRAVNVGGHGSWNFKPVASYMVSVLVAAVIGLAVSQTDKLLAFFQQGLGNLGIYNIATVGAAIASFAPSAATNVLVPALSALGTDRVKRREILRVYTRHISVIASPMGFGLAAVSPFLLQVFGATYVAGAPLLAVMSISIALTATSSVYASELLVDNLAHLFSVGSVLGLIALVLVALATVPSLGLMGIALGRSVMLLVTVVSFALFTKWRGQLVLDAAAYVKSVLSSAAMAVIVYEVLALASQYFLKSRGEVVVVSVVMMPVGFALYVIIMKLVKGFNQTDIDFFEKILPGWLSWLGELARKLL
jgi:O-antigen/teichoic acid export membrane protein